MTRKSQNFLPPLRDFISARGEQLEKLSIHWVCSAVGCLYEQVSAEFVFDFLGRSCPVLRELDVSGLKNISAMSLQQLLDTKLAQVRNNVKEGGKEIMRMRETRKERN